MFVIVGATLAVVGVIALSAASDDDGGRAAAGGRDQERGPEAVENSDGDGGEPFFAVDAPPPFESIAALASVSRLVVEADIQGPPEYRPFVEEDLPGPGTLREMHGSHIYRARVTDVIARSPEVDVEVGQVIEVSTAAANPALEDSGIAEEIRFFSTPLEAGPLVLFLATNTNVTLAGMYSPIGSDLGTFTVEGDQLSYRGYGPIAAAPVPRDELVAAVRADGVLASSLDLEPEPTGPRPPDDAPEWIPMEESLQPPAGR